MIKFEIDDGIRIKLWLGKLRRQPRKTSSHQNVESKQGKRVIVKLENLVKIKIILISFMPKNHQAIFFELSKSPAKLWAFAGVDL